MLFNRKSKTMMIGLFICLLMSLTLYGVVTKKHAEEMVNLSHLREQQRDIIEAGILLKNGQYLYDYREEYLVVKREVFEKHFKIQDNMRLEVYGDGTYIKLLNGLGIIIINLNEEEVVTARVEDNIYMLKYGNLVENKNNIFFSKHSIRTLEVFSLLLVATAITLFMFLSLHLLGKVLPKELLDVIDNLFCVFKNFGGY